MSGSASNAPRGRFPRREARLPIWLNVERKEVLGFTVNLSDSGLAIQVEPTLAQFEAGMPFGFGVLLPNSRDGVSGTAELAWVRPGERDVGGREVLGLGMRFRKLAPLEH